jgi:hypothetical protein
MSNKYHDSGRANSWLASKEMMAIPKLQYGLLQSQFLYRCDFISTFFGIKQAALGLSLNIHS